MPSESSKRGGSRHGAGRKPGSVKTDHREIVKQVRWTAAEWQQVENEATLYDMTPSEYIRGATLHGRDRVETLEREATARAMTWAQQIGIERDKVKALENKLLEIGKSGKKTR